MRKYGAFLIEENVYGTHETAARRPAEREGAAADPATHLVMQGRRPRSAWRSTGSAMGGFPTPSRKLEFYSQTLKDWKWPEHAVPTYAGATCTGREIDRDRGRDGAAAHLPAADADPHALRQRQVALRDLPQQPALAPPGGRGAARRGDRRPAEGHHRDRLLRRPGLGHRVDPARRGGLLAPPGALAARRADRRRALVHRAGRPRGAAARASGACATCTGCGRSRAPIPIRSASGGRTRASTRT